MRYRRFGKTELPLSVFSLGTMRCLKSEAAFRQTVTAAVRRGINHLETAQGYGASERYLGRLLRSGELGGRSQLYLTTKIPPTPDAEQLARQIDQSLEHLQTDYLDCLALHGINTPEHLQWTQSGCLEVIQAALADGRVRHIGFSTHGSLELILATLQTGYFEFVNLHYYYFFQRHAAAIALAQQQDLGIFIISPADKGGLLYTPPSRLENLCAPYSPLELTYRWLLSDRRITSLSLGPASPDELDWPLTVADRNEPLTSAEIAALQQLEQHQADALGRDRCAQCYECLPCPESIHIPEVLRLRNLAVAYDMTPYGQYRYGMFENAGHWFAGQKASRCTDCGDCLPRCPESLDIPNLLRDAHTRLKGPERRRLWG
ncbi:aldo/keto reductase [Sphaerothrix gracilis]|uniref:aldo/keto reductase n=1 Tax=Sphaerothrix gracilis TaxID=3151835 RepID=UPI0031FBF301